MTNEPSSAPLIQPISELFRSDCVAFWATTYNVDLALFNEYLLRRLGDPPLNAVVLADSDRLDGTLAAIPAERVDILEFVNRRWLLRGVRLGAGRFHPKTYLAVTPRTAKLLVGSGNLSTNGIDTGREVFTAFVAGTPHGDATIRTWLAWMRRLIDAVDDTLLADRFTDLRERLPKSDGLTAVAESPVWDNLDRPLADRFCEAVLGDAESIDELIVAAPFYDEAGEALGRLVDLLAPTRLQIYLASSTNVDGRRLASRVAAMKTDVETLAYVPDRFTHAKLVGAIAGGRAWLLSGSANLSHAALSLVAGQGNVEFGTFTELPADAVRAAFLPPEATAEISPLSFLDELTFEPSTDDFGRPPVRITRATLLADRRIQITTDSSLESSWRLADHEATQALLLDNCTATTIGPLAGPLVHVVDDVGTVLTNHVVVDDPNALHRVLEVGERTGSGRPPELTSGDLDTPLGQALLFLHRNIVMDVSERAGPGGGGEASRDEATGDVADDDLWNRLEREKLGRDPRAGTYARLLGQRPDGDGGVADPLIELLEAMRDRAPTIGALTIRPASLVRLLADDSGSRWTTSAKIRVRARNVLRRWAAAQTDPRLTWVDPLAPLGNLAMVAAIFGRLWCNNAKSNAAAELTDEDLDDLWARWFQPFVGTCEGDGWLDRIDLNQPQVQAVLTGDLATIVTGLCWLAIRPQSNRRERIVAWQPYLRAALDKRLVDASTDTAEFLSAAGFSVSSDRITDDLLGALDFIDDELWCDHTAADLGLTELSLQATDAGQRTSVRLNVRGVEHPLYDPRVPHLIVAVRRYRSTDSVGLFASDHDWRVVVSGDEPVAFKSNLDAPLVEAESTAPDSVDAIAAAHGVLADIFPSEAHVA